VLLGRQADLLVRLERLGPERDHLPGDPGVRRCPMHRKDSAVRPYQHGARVPSVHGHAPPRVRLPALLQGAAFALDTIRFLEWCRDRYGDVYEVRLPGMGKFVYIADPALIKQVFAADRDIGLAGRARRPFFEPLLGTQSLLTTDGEQWERQRKLIGPPFHAS
jgi:hypothetical protein